MLFPSNSVPQYGMIHNDHLGTPQKMTDSTGAVVWAADYKPFGEATITVSTITNNLRFPSQYYDAETGLNYNYFRNYNTLTGRYIESDQVGILASNNHLYIYTSNNPVMRTDPLGLLYNPFTLNHNYITRGPTSCPRCFKLKIVEKVYGFASLSADPSNALKQPGFFYSKPQPYVTIVTVDCKPSCCKEKSGPPVTQYGNGPLTSQSWFVLNLYSFTWRSETYQFDCSDCMTSCGCK